MTRFTKAFVAVALLTGTGCLATIRVPGDEGSHHGEGRHRGEGRHEGDDHRGDRRDDKGGDHGGDR
jgi:hypothetical protein